MFGIKSIQKNVNKLKQLGLEEAKSVGQYINLHEPVGIQSKKRIVAHGSLMSIPIQDLAFSGAAPQILEKASIKPQVKYGSPFGEGAKPIATGFIRRERLYLIRGVAFELFECLPEKDDSSLGKPIPATIQFKGTLRKDQIPVIERLAERFRALSKTGASLAVNDSDPGKGKTCMAIYMVTAKHLPNGELNEFRGPALIVVRGRAIIQQWVNSLSKYGVPGSEIGVIVGGCISIQDKSFIVASVDTIRTRGHEYPPSFWRQFRTTIFDEAHHMNTRTLMESYMRCCQSRYVLSLSGTWERSDGTSSCLRYMTGLPVGGAKNTMPVHVELKTFLPGKTEFVPMRGKPDQANTAEMINQLSKDVDRTRFIANNTIQYAEEGGKVIVIVDRCDLRDELGTILIEYFKTHHGETFQRYAPKLEECPPPQTPFAKYKYKLRCQQDKLFDLQTKAERAKRGKSKKIEEIEKAKARVRRTMAQVRWDTLKDMINLLSQWVKEEKEEKENNIMKQWIERFESEQKRIRTEYKSLKGNKLVQEERILRDFNACKRLLQHWKEDNPPPKWNRTLKKMIQSYSTDRLFLLGIEHANASEQWKNVCREEMRIPGIQMVREIKEKQELYPMVSVLREGLSNLAIERLKRSTIIVANAAFAREALDIPDIDRMVVGTPMARIKQCLGRSRREFPGKLQPVKLTDVVDPVEPFSHYVYPKLRMYRAEGFNIQWTVHFGPDDINGVNKKSWEKEDGEEKKEKEEKNTTSRLEWKPDIVVTRKRPRPNDL